MGADHSTAAESLRVLGKFFREPVRSGDITGRSATRTVAPAPIDVDVLDCMTAHLDEVIRGAEDDALAARLVDPEVALPPRPADGPGAYAYWAGIPVADERRQDHRSMVLHRQHLEHEIRQGNRSIIRQERCPSCRTFGLFWRETERRALCVNRHCPDDDVSRRWTLAQLAHHRALEDRRAARATS